MKIFFIGYRCTGKTTIGRSLAAKLGYDFKDTDQMIENKIGTSISQMVETHGWEAFRELEKKTLHEMGNDGDAVISTGGGIILNPENRRFIRENGKAVWLDADLHTILHRLCLDPNTGESRPALTQNSIEKETRELLAERSPMYEETAHIKIDTSTLTPDEIVTLIKRRLI